MRDDSGRYFYDPAPIIPKFIGKNRSKGKGLKKKLKPVIINGNAYYACHYCKKVFGIDSITVDHKVPKRKGGTNGGHNLLPACFECNNKKGDMDYDKFLETISIK